MNHATPELFRELIQFFFKFHDPTTANRQGNDVGSQYASYVFATDSVQNDIAQDVVSELQKLIEMKVIKYYASSKVTKNNDMVTTIDFIHTSSYGCHAEVEEFPAV